MAYMEHYDIDRQAVIWEENHRRASIEGNKVINHNSAHIHATPFAAEYHFASMYERKVPFHLKIVFLTMHENKGYKKCNLFSAVLWFIVYISNKYHCKVVAVYWLSRRKLIRNIWKCTFGCIFPEKVYVNKCSFGQMRPEKANVHIVAVRHVLTAKAS